MTAAGTGTGTASRFSICRWLLPLIAIGVPALAICRWLLQLPLITRDDHLRVVPLRGIVDLPPDVKGKTSRSTTLDIDRQIDVVSAMNDPEVIMLDALPSNDLIVYNKAIAAAGEAISLVRRLPAPLKSLADQVIRSAASVPANIAEGHGRSGRDRLHHWRIAYGSAKEVDCHLRLLVHAGAINLNRANEALRRFDEVRAMTWRLLHPKR